MVFDWIYLGFICLLYICFEALFFAYKKVSYYLLGGN
jgi:hypothetical protein